jgi:nucleoside-diphosphate-sugar epimerase
MKNVVVTGGSGRLGRQVIQELLGNGCEVLSLDRVAPQTKLCPSRLIDLTRSSDMDDALSGADAVIHLGAYQAPGLAPDAETFSNNVAATYNVLHAAAELKVRRAVIASSTAAFGFIYARRRWLPDYLPLDEQHPCRPQDPYGLSKVVGEKIADSFASLNEIAIASLRFPGIHFDFTYQSFPERWQNPAEKLGRFWSYIDVRDAASACRLALETELRGHEVFIVAAPTSTVIHPTDELMRDYLPGVRKARADLSGNWSGVDSRKAEKLLGFKAKHLWENYLKGKAA